MPFGVVESIIGDKPFRTGASSAARDQKRALAETARMFDEAYDAATGRLSPFADYEIESRDILQDYITDDPYMRLARDVRGGDLYGELVGAATDAVNTGFAGAGGLYSGNRAEALRQAGQGAFMQAYGAESNALSNYLNMLQNWANPTTTQQMGQYDFMRAGQLGSALQGQADVDMAMANRKQAMIGDLIQGAASIGSTMMGMPSIPSGGGGTPFMSSGGMAGGYGGAGASIRPNI